MEALAAQGKPSVSALVKHDSSVIWPRENLQVQVLNTEKPAAIAFTEVPPTIALLAGMFPKEMTAWLSAMVDTVADDKNALGPAERQRREAELQEALLGLERQEASLVWKAQAQGLPAEHRAECHPLAILGGQLRTIPAGDTPRRTSPGHAYDIVGGRNW